MLEKLNRTRNEGFTLIELMIVIAILGILAAVAIPNFLYFKKKSFDSRAKTQARNYYSMVLSYFVDTNSETVDIPPGFIQDANVIKTGTFSNANGDIDGEVRFKHVASDTQFTIVADGNISP